MPERAYRRAAPARLDVDGYAHHAYTTQGRPALPPAPAQRRDDRRAAAPDDRALDRAGRTGAIPRRLPIYLTEFGIQSDARPGLRRELPAPGRVPRDLRADRLGQPARRVVLAVPAARRPAARGRPRRQRYSGFESGLRTSSGRAKPALAAFPLSPLAARRAALARLAVGARAPARQGATTVTVEYSSGARLPPAGHRAHDAARVGRRTARYRAGRRYRVVWSGPDGTRTRPAPACALLSPGQRCGAMARHLWLLRHGEAEPHDAARRRRPPPDRPRPRAVARRRPRARRAGRRVPACLHEPEGPRARDGAAGLRGAGRRARRARAAALRLRRATTPRAARRRGRRPARAGRRPRAGLHQVVHDLTGARVALKKGGVAGVRLDGRRARARWLAACSRPRSSSSPSADPGRRPPPPPPPPPGLPWRRARAPRGRDHRAPPRRGAARRADRVGARAGHQRAEDVRPAAARARRPRRSPACAAAASTSSSTSRATSRCWCTSCPPGACSSSTSAPRCATARRACCVRLAGRARAAPARVRHEAGGVGQGAARRRPSRPTRRSPRSAPRPGPTRRRCASCSPPGRAPLHARAARPARDRRDRPLVGRRDPVDRASCRRSSAATTSTTTRPSALREAMIEVPRRRARALRAGGRRCRSPTSCRCRCRSTATTASRARAAARRSRPCTTRTTSCPTARPSRPAAGRSRTGGSPGCWK